MAKILKNNTASPVVIGDVGQTVPASGQVTIDPQDYLLYAASSDTVTLIGDSTLTVNDGSSDLSIANGSRLIQGIFPNPVGIQGSDGTQIGNVDDSLKVTSFLRPDPLSATYDSFGKLQVVVPRVVFDIRFINSLQPLVATTDTANGGTVTRQASTSSAALNVTATSGSKALIQSKEYIRYVPGRTALFYLAGRFSGSTTNRKQRLGCFSDDDGIFFEYENSTLYAVTRSSVSGSPVDVRVAQTSWNIDKLDGTGPSGITLDAENIQTYVLQYQWHGSGSRLWGFNINNTIYFVHKEDTANEQQDPWSATGDFPLRSEIMNSAAASGSATLLLQSFVALTGGESFTSISPRSVNRDTGVSLNSSTFRPAISLRLKAAFNRAIINPLKIPILSTSADNLEVKLLLNATLTGASWSSAGTNSIAEFDVSATAVSGGEALDFFYVVENGTNEQVALNSLLKLVSDYAGTADVLTVAVRSADTSASCRAGIVFEELF